MDTLCTSQREIGLEGYDPSTRCVFSDSIAIHYIGTPEGIDEDVVSAGFRVVDVELEHDDCVDTILIQAIKPMTCSKEIQCIITNNLFYRV